MFPILICLSSLATISLSFNLSIEKTKLIQDSKPLPIFTPDYSSSFTCHPSGGIYESSKIESRTLTLSSNTSVKLEVSIKTQKKSLMILPNTKIIQLNNESKTIELQYNCIGTGWEIVKVQIFDGKNDIFGQWQKYCGETQTFDFSLAALLVFAVAIVWFSSFRARFIASWEPNIQDQADVLTVYHAYGFIFAASGMLMLMFFFKDYLRLVFEVVVSIAGAVSVVGVLDEVTASWPSGSFNLPVFGKTTQKLLISILISSTLITIYFFTKNWILSNILAASYAYIMIKTIKIPDFKVGALLLSLVLLYDILWVYFSEYIFGDNVMVAVASNLDLPIKLLFPHTSSSSYPHSCSMLGLGDLVLPGLFLAFSSRFDHINNSNYLRILILCYTTSLILCIFILIVFQHAQPAMLFISPMLILGMLITAYKRQEFQKIFEGIKPQSLINPEEIQMEDLE